MHAQLIMRLLSLVFGSTIVEDEQAQTLVEISVSLVLSVLALGFAMAVATITFQALKIWQDETSLVNTFEMVTSAVDRDLEGAESIVQLEDSAWVMRAQDLRRGRDSTRSIREIVYRSGRGRITRDGRPLSDGSIHTALDVILPENSLDRITGASVLVRVRVSVRLNDRSLESYGAVLVRSSSLWDSP